MIIKNENIFQLDTESTSMVIRITKHGDAELLHYGAKIPAADFNALIQHRSLLTVNGLYPAGDVAYGFDDIAFAYSYAHRGDSRSEALRLKDENGGVFDFIYNSFEIDAVPNFQNYAHSYGYDSSLSLSFRCLNSDLTLELWFLVYENTDVITRFTRIVNYGNDVRIAANMSAQYDMPNYGYQLTTFDGAWARERHKTTHNLDSGMFVSCSRSGMSSAEHNPFFMLSTAQTSCNIGVCYGFNLIYSGNHEIRAEVDMMNRIRIQNGILRDGFDYNLGKNETFITPESVATYSEYGTNGMSQNMHRFIENHIIRNKTQLPVMLNSWEAMYFDITESKIEEIAVCAAELGFECLVVDDGWFGKRDDDTSSLGDWFYNHKKFPNGLVKTAEKINNIGLKFGLWVEPEMISIKSELFKAHPEWAIMDSCARKIVGRNQYILDLTNTEVQLYLIEKLSDLIADNKIEYLKWDFNRRFAEIGGGKNSGEFLHKYVCGLYRILDALTIKFPYLIIEGCAAGGGRFDLGILCYCPIVWASDNTDPYERMFIQEGTLYGYPPSCMLCHVSSSPNHQTGRLSAIKTRIAVASIGAFGAQMDIRKTESHEKEALKIGIENFKRERNFKEFNYYRLADGVCSDYFVWQTMSMDAKEGKILFFNKRFSTLIFISALKLCGLREDSIYNIKDENGVIVVKASGLTLMKFGFLLPQVFQGNEKYPDTVVLYDNTAIQFKIEAL